MYTSPVLNVYKQKTRQQDGFSL